MEEPSNSRTESGSSKKFSSENNFVPMELNPSVFIPDEVIEERVNEWRFSLIGRLDLVHLKISVAASILKNQWKLSGNCQFIHIGKGFSIIKLDNKEDMKYIYEGLWEVESQYLKLRFWERDFKPEQQKSTSAFVWILFTGLSIEYWKEEILMSMGKAIGRPIHVDNTTLKKEIGYYACILVEVDMKDIIPNKVETKYCKFEQEIRVSALPKFCSKCQIVGHLVTECRVARREQSQGAKPVHNTRWRYTPKKVQNTGGFDLCPPPISNDLTTTRVTENPDVILLSDTTLSVGRLLEVRTSIPSTLNILNKDLTERNILFNGEASELLTTQVLSNISATQEEWKEVARKNSSAKKNGTSQVNSVPGNKFQALVDAAEKQDQTFSKVVSKPTKGKIIKGMPNVITRKQANNSVKTNSGVGSSNTPHSNPSQ
ncbi:uncharacterized protein LOC113312392 [Papaver somniferum]|uniref:uncharacterized protein LOC113312392 n=1 Tax=Papaver somniferum TaxID=3469 RepID=UPI000E6FB26B|nr:uncharacterized protein LOC113312392 [Papaver somniferum]